MSSAQEELQWALPTPTSPLLWQQRGVTLQGFAWWFRSPAGPKVRLYRHHWLLAIWCPSCIAIMIPTVEKQGQESRNNKMRPTWEERGSLGWTQTKKLMMGRGQQANINMAERLPLNQSEMSYPIQWGHKAEAWCVTWEQIRHSSSKQRRQQWQSWRCYWRLHLDVSGDS